MTEQEYETSPEVAAVMDRIEESLEGLIGKRPDVAKLKEMMAESLRDLYMEISAHLRDQFQFKDGDTPDTIAPANAFTAAIMMANRLGLDLPDPYDMREDGSILWEGGPEDPFTSLHFAADGKTTMVAKLPVERIEVTLTATKKEPE